MTAPLLFGSDLQCGPAKLWAPVGPVKDRNGEDRCAMVDLGLYHDAMEL